MTKQFKVFRGDSSLYFEESSRFQVSKELWDEVIQDRLKKCPRCSHPYEVFPGLILENREGVLLKPELKVELVTYKPEE